MTKLLQQERLEVLQSKQALSRPHSGTTSRQRVTRRALSLGVKFFHANAPRVNKVTMSPTAR